MRRLLKGLVRLYQVLSGPIYGLMGGPVSVCRFTPSCSNYALEALDRHGAWVGSLLTVRRLCRCHPWGGQGYDPVPLPRKRQPRAIEFESGC
jgi:putative membrane protein insertion efficiency factor